MSDTPKTLAAILAEMRCEERPYGISNDRLRSYADRIDAAAKRKRASLEDALVHCRQYAQKIERENEEGETRLDAEEIIATVDNEFAGIRPEHAPGDAAALREALTEIEAMAHCDLANVYPAHREKFDKMIGGIESVARAALSAPARNCDRFRSLDDFSMADSPIDTPLTNATREQLYKVIRWLFAPAEGGDHA